MRRARSILIDRVVRASPFERQRHRNAAFCRPSGTPAFFTSERTEEELRATEYDNFLGELQTPRKSQRGAMSLTLVFAVLRGPPCSSVSLL